MTVAARFVLLSCILSAAAFGQNRSADSDPVLFDVTALDSEGRFAAGLTAADFEISRAGTPLTIVKAAAVDTHSSRTLVLLVDDLGLSRESLKDVRGALSRFVAEQLQSGDRIAIVRTGSSIGHMQQFTSDAVQLRSAIDLIEFNPLADSSGVEQNRFNVGTLLQLRFVFDGLKDMPGRKAVILFSERTSLSKGGSEEPTNRLAELANQGMATFYVIEAKAAVTPRLATGLAYVVKETGGLWIDKAADLSSALAAVCRDQEGHYLLSFQPGEHSIDYLSGRDYFPDITVKALHPSLRIRARSAVYGSGKPEDPEDAIRSPFAGSIAIRATPIFSQSPSAGSYVDVLLHIDAKRLTYVQNLKGEYQSVVEVAAAAINENGQPVGMISRVPIFTLTESGYRAALENGVLYSLRIELRKPGAYQVRALVRDDAAARTGAAGEYLEIPDLSKGNLAMSGIMVRPGATAPLDAASHVRQSGAVRIFRQGEVFGYSHQIFNIAGGGEMQVHVFRDGEEVFTGKPTAIGESGPDGNLRVISGSMALGQELTPGRYRFQIVVAGKPAEQGRAAVQSIGFEIRN